MSYKNKKYSNGTQQQSKRYYLMSGLRFGQGGYVMDLDVTSKESRALFYNSGAWKRKRLEIIEKDHFECQWCKAEGKVTVLSEASLEVDHIKELEEYPDLALEDDNLRTLCKDCHNKRHGRMNYRHMNKKTNKWQDERWD